MQRKTTLLALSTFAVLACAPEPEGDVATTDDAYRSPAATWTSSPDGVDLSRPIFVQTQAELAQDKDGDFQVDAIEAELASKIVPWVFFSQYEDARQSFEPVTLFQVIPNDCTGLGCPLAVKSPVFPNSTFRYRITVRFGFVWAYDSGYMGTEGSGLCGLDSHDGDTQGVTVQLVSYNGAYWIFEGFTASGHFKWPGYPTTFRNGTHPVLYFSAGKHHHFLDTSFDDEDSPESDWGCNDRIDEDGASFYPNLISPYADGRPNNVGEVANHSSSYFVHELGSYGYPGYSAWGTADFMDADPVRNLWIKDSPAPFTDMFLPPPYGTIHVHVNGASTSQVNVYYTEANAGPKPWGRIPVDASGNFAITLPASNAGTTYVVRPTASDYDFYPEYGFDEVPRAVTLAPGSNVNITFDAHALVVNNAPGNNVAQASPVASPILSAESLAKAAIANQVAITVDAPDILNALDDLNISYGTYALTGLPYRHTLLVKLYTLLGQNGAATSWPDAACYDVTLPYSGSHSMCFLGAPVAGASIEVSIIGGSKLIEPGADGSETVTTDANGVAKVLVVAGTHPGKLRVRVKVLSNPANAFFVPSRTTDVVIHPDSTHEDGNPYHFKAPSVIPMQIVGRSN